MAQIRKALAALIVNGAVLAGAIFGFDLEISPETAAMIAGLLSSVVVYFVPNRVPA